MHNKNPKRNVSFKTLVRLFREKQVKEKSPVIYPAFSPPVSGPTPVLSQEKLIGHFQHKSHACLYALKRSSALDTAHWEEVGKHWLCFFQRRRLSLKSDDTESLACLVDDKYNESVNPG